MQQEQEQGIKIVDEIVSLRQRVERAIEQLRTKLDEANASLNDSNRYASVDYWRLVAFSDGMIKVRLGSVDGFGREHKTKSEGAAVDVEWVNPARRSMSGWAVC
jgi:hypothetical protein